MEQHEPRRAAPPEWPVYAVCWLPLVAVYASLFFASGATAGQAIRGALWCFLPPALLGAPLLSSRFAAPEGTAWRTAARHAGRAVAFAAASTVLWLVLAALERAAAGGGKTPDPRVAAWQFVISGLLYAVLAAVAQSRRDAARLAEESERRAAADTLRARAELQALRSQLNPHFVLNALHTLHALVRSDPAGAERAIEDLGRLLQYGLRQQREDVDEVTLDEEWAFVEDYVRIESLRFGERLRVSLDAAEDARSCRLPPFSIQPLVENGVVHGVSPRAAGGCVRVEARRGGKSLRVTVQDDGPGPAARSVNGSGLGLKLIEQRLAALYGPSACLTLEAAEGGGTRATLEVPQPDEAGEDSSPGSQRQEGPGLGR